MAFKVEPVDQLTVTVEIETPQDHGKYKKEDMDVTFKKHPVSKMQADMEKVRESAQLSAKIRAAIASGDDSDYTIEDLEDIPEGPFNDDRLVDDILDIKGLKDAAGQEIAYTKDIGWQLLEMDYVRSALNEAWMKLNLGEESVEALKRKNVPTPDATGRKAAKQRT